MLPVVYTLVHCCAHCMEHSCYLSCELMCQAVLELAKHHQISFLVHMNHISKQHMCCLHCLALCCQQQACLLAEKCEIIGLKGHPHMFLVSAWDWESLEAEALRLDEMKFVQYMEMIAMKKGAR